MVSLHKAIPQALLSQVEVELERQHGILRLNELVWPLVKNISKCMTLLLLSLHS